MIVKCISTSGKVCPTDSYVYTDFVNSNYNLTENKLYVVYGMKVFAKYFWYYVVDDSNQPRPLLIPAPLFKIENDRLSKYWEFVFEYEENPLWTRIAWVFPEWAFNPNYYDALYDGSQKEVAIFKKYKLLMDLEFPDTSIEDSATILDEEYLGCKNCDRIWKIQTEDAMVVCPKCHKMMHNPYYSPVFNISS